MAPARSRAYIGLGGNIGDPRASMRLALARLRDSGDIITVSSLYETAPQGFVDQPAFLNAALILETALAPEELLEVLLNIEQELHRKRTFRNAPRTLDLDILLYDERVEDGPLLTIPHPRMHLRAFALAPLAEIAPDVCHPVLHQTLSDLLDQLGDVSDDVRLVEGPSWADL